MSWRDSLQPASFRNVSFYVRGGGASLGRRVDKHEYPQRDDAYVEDLGAVGNEFTIEAFLIGDNIALQRQALMRALNKEGPGTLIHPRLGAVQVQVGEARWTFGTGNRESFTIPFYRTTGRRQPETTVDTLSTVTTACDSASAALQTSFINRFNTSGVAGFVGNEAASLLSDGMQSIRDINRIANVANQNIADINLAIDTMVNDVTTLIRQPLQLVNGVTSVIRNVLSIDSDIQRALNSYRAINQSWNNLDGVPGNTANRNQQRANQAATVELFTAATTIETVRLVATAAKAINVSSASQSPFKSADESSQVRDELVASLDTIAASAGDELYISIGELQSQLAAHLNAHGNTLPRVRRIRIYNTLPALVIAHQLYGDAGREQDIIDRNAIPHPLFIDAGTELEVLNG